MVVTTNSHCKSVIISGTIFYIWDYYNHIVKSTIIILYYIFLGDIAIKNSCPLIVTNTIYFFQCTFEWFLFRKMQQKNIVFQVGMLP